MGNKLVLVVPPYQGPDNDDRLERVLLHALKGIDCKIIRRAHEIIHLYGERVLFAVALGESGINLEFCAMLSRIRLEPELFEGCIGGVLVDGQNEFHTKMMARELVFSANRAGCAFVGCPLVEGTGSLQNFNILAMTGKTDNFSAYLNAARGLVEQLLAFTAPIAARPNILMLHASNHETSNTLALWDLVKSHLGDCDITEIGLRNGSVVDCSGCPYSMCLHFGERGECFYGGVMVEGVYPAILKCNVLVLLCPNYNDALSANLTAFVNRMTALYRQTRFYDKSLFGIVVSGYSGSDIIAQQLIGALNMNKSFYLPPRFAMLETANNAGSILKLDGIRERAKDFADRIIASVSM